MFAENAEVNYRVKMMNKKSELRNAKQDYWYHRKKMEYFEELIKVFGGRVPK